jgi:hypothetical protein
LRDALTVCCDGNRLPAPWPSSAQASQDLHDALRVGDSPKELELTGRLARMIPQRILLDTNNRQMCAAKSRLLMSPAPELSSVPWPILPIGGPSDNPVRLIERYELQFIPSLAIISDIVSSVGGPAPNNVPFVMSCDYIVPDAFPTPPRAAKVRFGTAQQQADDATIMLATPEAVASFLRGLEPATPGLISFRTHFNSVGGDPSASGFELNGGSLEVGWLLPRDARAGRTILGLSSRVLLSCCSTSAAQERYGGESLGLVAACLRSGAQMIVATSVNIPHTSFTNAFDDMLTAMLLDCESHVRGLRILQTQMLRIWRSSKEAGVYASESDIQDPLPVVWAYYQACGVDY